MLCLPGEQHLIQQLAPSRSQRCPRSPAAASPAALNPRRLLNTE